MVKELSIDAKIREILEHFKQDDPLGIPGVPIPDPKAIPDIEKEVSGAKVLLTEAMMHDQSKFRIDYVRTDLKDLKVTQSQFNQTQFQSDPCTFDLTFDFNLLHF